MRRTTVLLDGLMFGEAPRWSGGFGVRGETFISTAFQLQVGFSREGAEIQLTIGAGP